MRVRKIDRCGLELLTESDRDTAAKMIEAMVWAGECSNILIDQRDGEHEVLGTHKGAFFMASGPTPWDAILAAKEASK